MIFISIICFLNLKKQINIFCILVRFYTNPYITNNMSDILAIIQQSCIKNRYLAKKAISILADIR